MGSLIEFNDTLVISKEQGFPDVLDLKKKINLEDVKDSVFEFTKKDARVFHTPPVRNFLVQNIDDKWLYWGEILVIEQTIKSDAGKSTTSGKFKIVKIYSSEYQVEKTKNESKEGMSYF